MAEELNADLFSIKSDKKSLKCHQNDCAMNVFNFLELIPTQDALGIANITDGVYASRIKDFLTDTFGVKFVQNTIWEKNENDDYSNEPMLSNLWDDLDELPSNKGIIVFMYKEGEIGHYAVIGKITDSKTENIYFFDPQKGHKFLLLNKKMDKLLKNEGYEKIDAFRADGPAIRFKPDIHNLKKKLKFNKNYNNIWKAVNTEHFGKVLKHVSKGVVIHHQPIKGVKYQIIDKDTREQIDIGTLVSIVNGIATFINGTETPTFDLPVDDFNYIRIKSVKVRSTRKSNTKRKGSYISRKIKSA